MNIFEDLKSVIAPIHPEGHIYVLVAFVVTLLLFLFVPPLGWLAALITAWCAYFFRDPDRVTPVKPGLIVSPADGRVALVDSAVPPAELEMGDKARPRVGIFMNVFDVHVNRAPADGEIVKIAYHPGLFLNASLDKASEDNERKAFRMKTAEGKDIAFVQIAGLVARRIVSWVDEGHEIKAGERFGMIRFGSRVDVYLDEGMSPLVAKGQRMIAGETVLADSKSREKQRPGEVRS